VRVVSPGSACSVGLGRDSEGHGLSLSVPNILAAGPQELPAAGSRSRAHHLLASGHIQWLRGNEGIAEWLGESLSG
jgi:hypothetical protein